MIEYTNSQIATLIDEHIHSDRDRSLLKDRYINRTKFEALAEKYDISVRQAKNIVYRSERKLIKYL